MPEAMLKLDKPSRHLVAEHYNDKSLRSMSRDRKREDKQHIDKSHHQRPVSSSTQLQDLVSSEASSGPKGLQI